MKGALTAVGAGPAETPLDASFPRGTSHFMVWALPLLARSCPAGNLLELGCGSGRDLRSLVRRGFRVVGVDYARNAVIRARCANARLPHRMRSNVRVVEAEMLAYLKRLPPSAVDAVYAVAAYQHLRLDELHRLFDEIHRVLRPRGLHLYCVQDASDPHHQHGQVAETEDRPGSCQDLPCRYFSVEICEQLSRGRYNRLQFHRNARIHRLCIADRRTDDPVRVFVSE